MNKIETHTAMRSQSNMDHTRSAAKRTPACSSRCSPASRCWRSSARRRRWRQRMSRLDQFLRRVVHLDEHQRGRHPDDAGGRPPVPVGDQLHVQHRLHQRIPDRERQGRGRGPAGGVRRRSKRHTPLHGAAAGQQRLSDRHAGRAAGIDGPDPIRPSRRAPWSSRSTTSCLRPAWRRSSARTSSSSTRSSTSPFARAATTGCGRRSPTSPPTCP